MQVEHFVSSYSKEFTLTFLTKEQPEQIKKHVELIEEQVEESMISKISSFLFEPRYTVNNLKFKAAD